MPARQMSGSPTAESPEIQHQLLVIGRSDGFAAEFRRRFDSKHARTYHVPDEDWKSASWQRTRTAGESWALIALPSSPKALHETLDCTRLVRVTFRPTRLIVLTDISDTHGVLSLIRAGADGVLPAEMEVDSILSEFGGKGIDREEYFPDPQKWLAGLSRAASEIDLTLETGIQLKKLLRIFVSQLGVDRASIMLLEGDGVRLAAAIGFPDEIDYDAVTTIKQGSITDWVVTNRRSRLIVGAHSGSRPLSRDVSSSVCAPIMSKGEVLGAVNFSTARGERQLGPADLQTTEVFASLLGMSINNQRLARQVIESERLAAIGATMSSVSHCLKNLLTIFRGSVGIMEHGLERQDIGQLASGLKLVGNGVRRIENLVFDLLDMSKQREPELSLTELDELIREVGENFEVGAQHKRHKLELECIVPGAFPLDAFRLQRALMNLLSNSFDAIADGGRIRLRAGEEGDMLVLSVSDTGPGVPPEALDTIFKPFFSTKGSTGTGLGLAMVHKFCEENGGRAVADHDPELNGLRICIKLPKKGALQEI